MAHLHDFGPDKQLLLKIQALVPAPAPAPAYDAPNKKQLLALLKLVPVIFRIVIMLSYLFAFALLVGVDAVKAFIKRAHWIPGNALVLSAITIQALAFVGLGFVNTSEEPHTSKFVLLLYFQLIVDGGRLSMCIFIAYVLPRMVGSRSAKDLRLITALAITLFVQIMYELYYVYRGEHEIISGRRIKYGVFSKRYQRYKGYVNWYMLSTYVLFVSMIFLVAAITCAVIAGKTVRRLLQQRIAVIFSTAEAQNSKKHTWMDFEDDVFKSWVVTRVSQPDYVMARSVLNSAAALVATLCTLFFILKTILIMHYYGKYFNNYFQYALTGYTRTWIWFQVFAVCSFVTVGWVVICCRWITTVLFFPKLTTRGRRFFYVEDFWTNSITELQHVCHIKSLTLQRSDTDFVSLVIKIVAKMRLHKLLYAISMLQIFFVMMCKGCHLLSEMVCVLLHLILKRLLVRTPVLRNPDQEEDSAKPYSSRYEDFKDILERMCMPGEDPKDLWKANSSSINQIQLSMEKGREKGSKWNTKLLKQDSAESCGQWIEQGFTLLSKLRGKSLSQVEHYFPDLKKPCWKLTAVSLLNVIIQLRGEDLAPIMPFIKACEEVWDMMSFADNANVEGDRVKLVDNYDEDVNQVSMAADQEFSRIQKASHGDVQRDEAGHGFVEKKLKQSVALLKAHHLLQEESASADNSALHDSMDWMKIALNYSLYKLLKVMEEENSDDLVAWAESSLKNIITACLSELPHILCQYGRQCAQEFNEDALWNTVYIAGKTRGVWEALRLQPILKKQQTDEMERWLVDV